MVLLMGAMFMMCSSIMSSVLMYATNFGVPKRSTASRGSSVAAGQLPQAATGAIPYDIPEGIKTDCPPGKRGIIGWEHEIRSGKSYMWCGHDSGRGSGISYIGNDKLSYLSVPPGMKVTLYENNDMAGLYKAFEVGEWDLRQHTFDKGPKGEVGRKIEDRASSLKIEGLPVNASTAATSGSLYNMNR